MKRIIAYIIESLLDSNMHHVTIWETKNHENVGVIESYTVRPDKVSETAENIKSKYSHLPLSIIYNYNEESND